MKGDTSQTGLPLIYNAILNKMTHYLGDNTNKIKIIKLIFVISIFDNL